jgi:hypothetical protein
MKHVLSGLVAFRNIFDRLNHNSTIITGINEFLKPPFSTTVDIYNINTFAKLPSARLKKTNFPFDD